MYLSTTKRALWASMIISVLILEHLPYLPLEHLNLLFSVSHSSDVASSRIWHVSSTIVLAEQKPKICTSLIFLCKCPGNCLRSREESTKTDSCSTRSGSTCVGYMSMLIIPVKRQAYTWTHTLASVDIYLSLGQDEHALHSIRKSPTKDRTSVKQRNQREIIVVRHKIPNTQ
jgi:hypothetical protein